MITKVKKEKKKKKGIEVPLRFELRSQDSRSQMLTITPQDPITPELYKFRFFQLISMFFIKEMEVYVSHLFSFFPL